MPIDVSQVHSLAVDLGKAGPAAVAKEQTVIVRTAHDIEGTGKQLAAVDTGTMRGSIGVEIGVLTATIGPTVDYAPYVEYGTSRMAPQPFMNPAADQHEAAFLKASADVIAGIL